MNLDDLVFSSKSFKSQFGTGVFAKVNSWNHGITDHVGPSFYGSKPSKVKGLNFKVIQ